MTPALILPAFAFYLFAGLTLFSGLMVITARNPVHGVLFLILAFFNAAGLFVLLGAEFLAMILVVVYVGAVAVLFLFVVMMLDVDFAALKRSLWQNLIAGLVVALILAAELVAIGSEWVLLPGTTGMQPAAGPTNTQSLGELIYTHYLYTFELSGLILLVAMIGAIVLTHRRRVGVRRQVIARQVGRSRAEAVEVVKVPVGSGV